MARYQRPVVDGIRVDLAALQAVAHNCRPELCRGGASCCSRYTPHVDQAELDKIVGFFPMIARYARGLEDAHGFRNVFEECPDASYCIDAKEDESCVFSYETSFGAVFCALHAVALDLMISPAALKPRACSLWPLTLSEGPVPELSIDVNWREFPCNTPSNRHGRLDAGVINIVAACFGLSFLKKLL